MSYTITPAEKAEVVLAGGGRASIGEFTLNLSSQNTGRGSVVYRVSLVRLEDVPDGVTVTAANPRTLDAALQVSPTPTPTPNPTPTPVTVSYCSSLAAYKCTREGGCWISGSCECDYTCVSTPVIIDTRGDGFALTDAAGGVAFDIDGDGHAERLSWTAADSDDAFLFLDNNENGAVDNGGELFGNFTVQPPPPAGVPENGFNALATHDRPGFLGGNGDGVIDGRDAVYLQLRLWRDANHDGRSDPRELHTLPESGVESISLDYRESSRTDRHGNLFRYRAAVYGANRRDLGRWAYDVSLIRLP